MKKINKPIITNEEILARAIRSIDEELMRIEDAAEQIPGDMARIWREGKVKPLRAKRDALEMLYRIETGYDYYEGRRPECVRGE